MKEHEVIAYVAKHLLSEEGYGIESVAVIQSDKRRAFQKIMIAGGIDERVSLHITHLVQRMRVVDQKSRKSCM